VGLAGLTAGLAGAEAVALSDFGAVEGDAGDAGDVGAAAAGEGGGAGANTVVAEALQPAALLSNLAYNVARNELAGRCAPQRLDWHASLAPGFAPARRFPLVFGSSPPNPQDRLIITRWLFCTDAIRMDATPLCFSASALRILCRSNACTPCQLGVPRAEVDKGDTGRT
jgi:hypothetical protein